jgi:hypothetical protein
MDKNNKKQKQDVTKEKKRTEKIDEKKNKIKKYMVEIERVKEM